MPLAVVDTSCLIAFERIERPALVPALFSEALMPPAVADEYGGVPDGFALRSLDNPSLARTLCEDLDAGEAEVIALTQTCKDAVALIDEKKGRRLSREHGLSVVGTLGILLRAKRRGLISAVKPLMDTLSATGFRLSDALYQDVLHRAGEG